MANNSKVNSQAQSRQTTNRDVGCLKLQEDSHSLEADSEIDSGSEISSVASLDSPALTNEHRSSMTQSYSKPPQGHNSNAAS